LVTFWLFLQKKILICFSSSSTAAEVTPIWQQQLQQPPPLRNGVQASSIQHLGKEYSRLEGALNQPDTLFSSEGSSSASEAGEYQFLAFLVCFKIFGVIFNYFWPFFQNFRPICQFLTKSGIFVRFIPFWPLFACFLAFLVCSTYRGSLPSTVIPMVQKCPNNQKW
jgi:hypothetical protein